MFPEIATKEGQSLLLTDQHYISKLNSGPVELFIKFKIFDC